MYYLIHGNLFHYFLMIQVAIPIRLHVCALFVPPLDGLFFFSGGRYHNLFFFLGGGGV